MRFQKLLLGIVVCLCLSVVVHAHPGGTDSDGGHTDHDTGEYHYHHGYSAHQHEDLDGDGVLDCPYEFDDKTEYSSGTTTESDTEISDASTKPLEKEKNSKKVKDYLLPIICCFALYGVVWLVDAIKWRLKK